MTVACGGSIRVLLVAAALAVVAPGLANAQEPALTPVQSAYLRAETRKVEDRFVQQVAAITGAKEEQVRKALPAQGRITDRLARLFSALERDLGAPLTDEQRGRIFVADGERKRDLEAAKRAARAR